MDEQFKTKLQEIAEEHCGQQLDDGDIDQLDDCEENGRYVLFERGHYGNAYVSGHSTLAEASHYTLNQEYAEDWSAQVVLDRKADRLLMPASITWEPVGVVGRLPRDVEHEGEVWMVHGHEYDEHGYPNGRWILKKSPKDKRRTTYDWKGDVDPATCTEVEVAVNA